MQNAAPVCKDGMFTERKGVSMRLLLISHAATAAMRGGRFPADDLLDDRGIAAATAWRERLPALRDAIAFSSPAACARDTAQALGLAASVAPELAETDHGRWRGRRLADIAVDESSALTAWSRDPDAAPHGGESFSAVLARVGAWLDGLDDEDAPSATFSRIEIAPLSIVELRRSVRGWAWWPVQS
jgi:broad specificity phosphatase PhoE